MTPYGILRNARPQLHEPSRQANKAGQTSPQLLALRTQCCDSNLPAPRCRVAVYAGLLFPQEPFAKTVAAGRKYLGNSTRRQLVWAASHTAPFIANKQKVVRLWGASSPGTTLHRRTTNRPGFRTRPNCGNEPGFTNRTRLIGVT